jgi:hypothetical protein
MTKRLFWIALGAAAGVIVVNRASKALRRFSPSGLADSAAGLPGSIGGVLQGFADDVRAAAADREFELYRALGVDVEDPEHPAK